VRPNLKRVDSVPEVKSSPQKAVRKKSRRRLRVVSQKTGTPGGTVRGRNSDRPDGHLRKAASKQAVTSYKAEQYAEFRRGMQAHEPLTALCTRLEITKNTASNWIREMHIDDLTVLRACGVNAMLVAQTLDKLVEAKIPKWNRAEKKWDLFDDCWVQLKAVHEICLLLDLYPRPRQKAPDGPSVQLFVSNAPKVGAEPFSGSTTKVQSQCDDREQKETRSNKEQKSCELRESAGESRLNERPNDDGRVADLGTQPSSSTTNSDDTRELRERWRNEHRTPFEAEFAGQSPWTTPIVESAAERFLELVALMKSGYDEESSSWADVLA
jgi:hypothetical protein